MINLSKSDLDLLLVCLEKHRKDLIYVIEEEKIIELDVTLGEELRQAVCDEFISNGLEGEEPNHYGLQCEDLIDKIGRLITL